MININKRVYFQYIMPLKFTLMSVFFSMHELTLAHNFNIQILLFILLNNEF